MFMFHMMNMKDGDGMVVIYRANFDENAKICYS